jgi:hypothetical protein
MILNYFPAGAKLALTGEVILWGYLDDPMSLREKANRLFLWKNPVPQRGILHGAVSEALPQWLRL